MGLTREEVIKVSQKIEEMDLKLNLILTHLGLKSEADMKIEELNIRNSYKAGQYRNVGWSLSS